MIVFVFSSDHCNSQEKLETMLKQNLGGQTKSIRVFSEVAYIKLTEESEVQGSKIPSNSLVINFQGIVSSL